MKKNITVRGITHKEAGDSQAIRNYIDENLAKIGHLLDHVKDPVFIDITIDIAKPHPHHCFDFRLHGPHFEIIVKKEGPELYLSIDEGFEIITRKLNDHKKEMLNLRRTANRYKSD